MIRRGASRAIASLTEFLNRGADRGGTARRGGPRVGAAGHHDSAACRSDRTGTGRVGQYRVFAVVVIGAGFHWFVLGPLAGADPSHADARPGAASE